MKIAVNQIRPMGLWLLGLLLLLPLVPNAADPCSESATKLDAEILQLRETMNEWKELNEKFSNSVKQDFNAQTEGLVDELHRNEAVKVAFARKQLSKTLEKRKASVKSLREAYCTKCSKFREVAAVKIAPCDRCPESGECAVPGE